MALSQQASSSTSHLEILIWRRLYLEVLRGVIVMWRGAGRAEAGRTGPTVNWRGLTPTEHLRNWAAGRVLPSSAVRGSVPSLPLLLLALFINLPTFSSTSTPCLLMTQFLPHC